MQNTPKLHRIIKNTKKDTINLRCSTLDDSIRITSAIYKSFEFDKGDFKMPTIIKHQNTEKRIKKNLDCSIDNKRISTIFKLTKKKDFNFKNLKSNDFIPILIKSKNSSPVSEFNSKSIFSKELFKQHIAIPYIRSNVSDENKKYSKSSQRFS